MLLGNIYHVAKPAEAEIVNVFCPWLCLYKMSVLSRNLETSIVLFIISSDSLGPGP